MVDDPQAKRRRPHPEAADPTPIDALLRKVEDSTPARSNGVANDPPPTPAVTPAPADPPSDTVLVNTGLAVAAIGLLVLLTLRHLWKRRSRRATVAPVDD